MLNEFEYKGFEPTEDMEAEGQAVIEEIQDYSPKRLNVVAMVVFDGAKYSCSFDAYLKRGSITTAVTDPDFSKALLRAKEIVLEKLSKHKETKFFTKESSALTNIHPKPFELLQQN